jgi:hypothetical protein
MITYRVTDVLPFVLLRITYHVSDVPSDLLSIIYRLHAVTYKRRTVRTTCFLSITCTVWSLIKIFQKHSEHVKAIILLAIMPKSDRPRSENT